jgi:hypothetical protein
MYPDGISSLNRRTSASRDGAGPRAFLMLSIMPLIAPAT